MFMYPHGDHPSLLYTWGPSISILYTWGSSMHPYCTHGYHPPQLYTWGPSIPIVHMVTIHPYYTHGDHPSLLYTWRPSIPIVHVGVGHRTPLTMCKWWGLYCHIFSLPLQAPLTYTSSCQASGYNDICITGWLESIDESK